MGPLADLDPHKPSQHYVGVARYQIPDSKGLKNADSFAWFFIAMLQGRDDDTLTIAKRFSGVYNDLTAGCTAFEAVQRKVVSQAERAIDGMVKIDAL